MKQYTLTTQKQLREEFWRMCQELNVDYTGKKTKFDTTLACMFNDWTDSLEKNGEISPKLRFRAVLY